MRVIMNIRYIVLGIGLMTIQIGLFAQSSTSVPKPTLESNDFFDPTKPIEKHEDYQFQVLYRIEAGYLQNKQRTTNSTYPDMYLRGAKIGATFDFVLPKHFTAQVGLLYALTYGTTKQHWRSINEEDAQVEYLKHRLFEHNLLIPIRVFYNIPLWKKLSLFFYTGPQMRIGLVQKDNIQQHLSLPVVDEMTKYGVPIVSYDRLKEDELRRFNILYGLGGGFDWDRYRLQAGYDFGLNNLIKTKTISKQNMYEWSWYISFAYRF